MAPEKKARIKELREKLANLEPAQREELARRALIATVEGRTLSARNTMLVYMQTPGIFSGNGHAVPTVVGGYRQWQRAGKQVRKGERAYTIFIPIGTKSEGGDITDVAKFYTASVFDISQVGEAGTATATPEPTPEPAATSGEQNIMDNWRIV